MSVTRRLARHARLSAQATGLIDRGTPPFLILFVCSVCNLRCDHCFYWRRLNQKDDLTLDEIKALSRDIGPLENLYLSGGEPFLREDLAEICLEFIRRNGTKLIYVPTNGYYTERTIAALRKVFADPDLAMFTCELSLDGTTAFHNEFRGNPRSFENAMETYDALAEFAEKEPRLSIHAISTVTDTNADEIEQLTTYLFERCPKMSHHNLALIRGERKDPALAAPVLARYRELDDYRRRLWAEREEGRLGGIVDPMLTWAKLRTAREQRQVVPCKAGVMVGVVNANGDVQLCETTSFHPPIGNLRDSSFREIWNSPAADEQRRRIRSGECHCTGEMFLWPSLTYQPPHLVRAFVGARAWRSPEPLSDVERERAS